MASLAEVLGGKIRSLREGLGLSQQELAERAGFSAHQIVSQIETGKRDVKAWELAKLASILRTSVSTLLAQDELQQSPVILWREAPASNASMIEKDFVYRCEQYAYLEKLCNVAPRTSFPRLQVDPSRFSFSEAHELALVASREFGLGARPAASLIDILENSYQVKILYEDLGEEGSAASTIGSFGPAILMNRGEAPWRRNYNFAHEVFHLLTWSDFPAETIMQDSQYRDRIEKLANAFASGLLLPADAVNLAFERRVKENKIRLIDLVEMAREFDVSTSALLYRLLNLGRFEKAMVEELLNDPSFRQLDRGTMPERWWTPPPIPERFVRLAFKAYQDGNISRTKLADLLDVSLLELTKTLSEYGLNDREDYQTEMRTARC